MIKRTFQTLKENPVIILAYAIIMVLTAIIMFPMFIGENSMYAQMMQTAIENPEAMNDFQASFMKSYFSMMGMMVFIYLVMGFIVLPIIFNKTYEACMGIKEEGWIMRGLKKNWWKVVVTGLIIGAASTVVVIVAVFVMIIPVIGFLAYLAAIFALSIFSLVAFAAVIAEDDFGTGLNNIFRVGTKIFWKELGGIALAAAPAVVISIIATIAMTVGIVANASAVQNQEQMLNLMMTVFTGWPMIIFIVVICVYYAFAGAFLYTYTMHQYLNMREQLNTFNSNNSSNNDSENRVRGVKGVDY